MGKFQARLWRWADRPMQYRVKILPMEFLVKWRLDRDRLLHTEHPLHSLRFSRQKVAWEVVGSSHIQHHLNRKCRCRSPTRHRKCRRGRSPTRHRKCRRGRSPTRHRKWCRGRSPTRHRKCSRGRSPTQRQKCRRGRSPTQDRKCRRGRSPTQDRKCCRGRLLTQHLSLSLVAKLVSEAQQFNKVKLVVLSREVL